MAVLHGSWQLGEQALFLWAEAWKPTVGKPPTQWQVPDHPRSLSAKELKAWLPTLVESGCLKPGAIERLKDWSAKWRAIGLPTLRGNGTPLLAGATVEPEQFDRLEINLWWVEGLWVPAALVPDLLQGLPLAADETPIAGDLRFWSHVARWGLDLVARAKAVPTLAPTAEGVARSRWQPLLEGAVDRSRLEHFTQQMPSSCRFFQTLERPVEQRATASNARSLRGSSGPVRITTFQPISMQLPAVPAALLSDFLGEMVDARLRATAATLPLPGERRVGGRGAARGGLTTAIGLPPVARDWLSALGQANGTCQSALAELVPLARSLQTWLTPLAIDPATIAGFCAAFRLHPPQPSADRWYLEYGLQSIDQAGVWIPAQQVWRFPVERLQSGDRVVNRPQETLLRGLGLAARLFPALEATLDLPMPSGCELSAVEAYQFVRLYAQRFQDNGLGALLPASLRNQTSYRLGVRLLAGDPLTTDRPNLGLRNLLNFRWELSLGDRALSAQDFETLLAKTDLDTMPLVEIGGEWVELRPHEVRAARDFLAKRQGNLNLTLDEALRITTGENATIDKLPVVQFESSGTVAELMNALGDRAAIEPVITPPKFQGQLRPYQERGVAWLSFLERWGLGACLADDMGLGKTPSTIAFLLHLRDRAALVGPVLLVCPTSVLGNWQRELAKFAPDLRVLLHHGDRRLKGKALARAAEDLDVVLISYSLVFRDEMTLQAVPWCGIVLDEAQNIKNAESKQSQAVKRLAAVADDDSSEEPRPVPFRIALTGTPVENRLAELWSIMDFLNPGYLGTQTFFQRRFATPIERFGDGASLQTLRSLVQPFILRRLKTDKTIIQDLPEKQEFNLFCGLSASQAERYQALVDEALAAIESSDGIQRRGQILALLVKLKQVCNYPALVGGEGEPEPSDRAPKLVPTESPKLQRLGEMLEEVVAEGDRALIFTQFARWGHWMHAYLQQHLGRDVLFLHGGTPQKQRDTMVERFQNDPQSPPIFILSLKAGGTGLNLTRANHVFHFDRWWNPAVENQATDRAFRIGQTRNVQVHKFICTGTLEEKIHDLLESKKVLAEQIVGTGETWLGDLDTDALRDLLLLDRAAIIEDR
ncbi:DEAD/DEAH box helicase [Limnothrix redekei]|uniref:DEAD/DEAH box helicase n=1 Tax=Limnothrix redekei LRLZ20PSL1 TaxID=3112953 RepID=A0ABW7C965_9CYAN